MADRPAAIRFDNVVKEYAAGVRAVDGVTLDVPVGAFVVLIGPSGCGKTTLLKTVNRLFEPTAGTIYVDGEDALAVDRVRLRRRIGYVIQQVGLFPHMSVARNVATVPELLGWPRVKISARVDELLDLVHLEPKRFRDRYPRQLSGGQQQRVGLARALAADPSILLMDEPFGAVDAIEREHLQDEMASLHARLRTTILFVTHDVDEALRLADAVAVMRAGKVEQYATPLEVLAHPANDFVAQLLGSGDVVRRLALIKVERAMTAASEVPQDRSGRPNASQAALAGSDSLREALGALLATDVNALPVVEEGKTIGSLSLDDVRRAARQKA